MIIVRTSINSERSGFKVHEVKLCVDHESISVVENLSLTMSVAMNEYHYIAAGTHRLFWSLILYLPSLVISVTLWTVTNRLYLHSFSTG